MLRRIAAGATLLCVALLTGCDDGNPFGTVKVSGTVTYEDGTPVPGDLVVVRFYPQVEAIDAKTHPRQAIGYADAEGVVSQASTLGGGDGVIAGPQKVTVSSLDANERHTGAVPMEYSDVDRTPIEIEIDRKNRTFELKVKKPS